ncbi:alpha/beta fold hydrolase [Rugamonas sp. CCM 8940]|uniref:alpha/beta fold hydrolase n=1 Tax=Rugamonas sp. CCM 8940 TaxID=2765359 RepID=UPI0018F3D389|nr:alpha/beta hydrolase [Rugamonas sp. CCM 8940]MBJ7309575.1 alpha/beta hydrolase [Rugamonas sp. CCM 8940]
MTSGAATPASTPAPPQQPLAPLPPLQLFELPFGAWTLKGDHFPGARANNALVLHGAGSAARPGYTIMREALQRQGIGSTCFDCIGHGETGGALAQSSLASRTRQAQAVIAARRLPAPLHVLGASMGAYNAIRLSALTPVASLILFVPGVYAPGAYELAFGPEFSAAIRRPRSWDDSDAWAILEKFEGALLLVAAEHDAVIPLEIPQRLLAAAGKARWRHLHVLPGAEHNRVWSLMLEQPELYERTLGLMLECMQAGGTG